MAIRVLIADDHAVVRRGLAQILEDEPGIRVVAEATDGDSTLEAVRSHRADVLILDLNMPGPSGLSLLATLRAEFPEVAVLILTVHSAEQYGPRLLRAGASGFLEKNTAPEHLVEAIKRVADGRRYISSTLAEALLDESRRGADGPPHRQLSDREFQVFESLARGLSVTEIADRLALSVKTVSTYRSRVMTKLDIGSNAELARYAVRHGLLD